ncbi:hypothetical protein V1527DRAFT_515710 [Lipomyces starkeyi]
MDLLLEKYFDSVHWFSLVIFEPRFRPEYESVADGAWDSSMASYLPDGDCNAWRVNFLSLPEARFLELMDESNLASIQTGINDSDCNVSMPGDVYERARPKLRHMDVDSVICYSVNQRQLTVLYSAICWI